MPPCPQNALVFFTQNLPSWRALVIGGPLSLVWAAGCLAFAGVLKKRAALETGYSRKVFHFLIFGTVSAIHWVSGTPGVCLFGGMTSFVLLYAILRGSGHFMYEAIARERDAPRRTYFIVVPYFATLIGGLLSNILFGAAAIAGYLATGLGDAVAEPVGARFGRHKYRVPCFGGVMATRSIEGSGSVLIVSVVALTVWAAASPEIQLSANSAALVAVIGVVATIVEAASPHGWDNATMQIVPAWLASALLL